MPKAYSYIRFSTPEQRKGDSLRRQTEMSEKFAVEHNLELDFSLNLADLGVSAFDRSNITKGALGEFLKLVEAGKIPRGSYLLVESLDRLSRAQIMDALGVFINILNAGITIVTLADNVIYSRESTNDNWANLIMSIVIMSRASEESLTKSRRGRAAWDNKRANLDKKRLTGRCPYWMKPLPGDRGFELIPDRVEIVRRIFAMSKSGIGVFTITKRLNQEGVPPFSKTTDGWQNSYIIKILNNTAIYGEVQFSYRRDGVLIKSGDPIPNYYPPLMSKEEWLQHKSLRQERKSRGGARKGNQLSNLFSGLLQCGYCNGPAIMGGRTEKKANARKPYFRYINCSRARRGAGCNHYAQWAYDDLESWIIRFCKSVDYAAILNKPAATHAEFDAIQQQLFGIKDTIASNQLKIKNLMMALEDSAVDSKPAPVLERIVELSDEVEQLKQEEADLQLKLSQVEVEIAEHASQHIAMVELLDQLHSLEGDELHDLRSRLSSYLKRSIQEIRLFPFGTWLSAKQRKEQFEALQLSGFTAEQIEEYFDSLPSKPNKKARFIFVFLKNKEALRISEDAITLLSKDRTIQTFIPDAYLQQDMIRDALMREIANESNQ